MVYAILFQVLLYGMLVSSVCLLPMNHSSTPKAKQRKQNVMSFCIFCFTKLPIYVLPVILNQSLGHNYK